MLKHHRYEEQSIWRTIRFQKPKGATRSVLPIYLRISAGGQRTEVSTRRSWQSVRWDATTGRAMGTREDARTLNAYLSALQTRVYEVYLQLVNNHQDVTAEALKDGLSGVKRSGRTLIPIFQRHNEQLAKLVGAEFAQATLDRYETALDHTVAFLRSRYQTDDIGIDKLDYEFVTEYEFRLKSSRQCAHNTAVKYISNLRKVVNICLKNGWLVRDLFLGYKMTKREVVRAVLTQNEIDVMTKKELAIERLAVVRDLFLFSCYTRLAYGDIKKLKRSEVATGVDGEKWIFTSRQKTDTASRIPLQANSENLLLNQKCRL